MPRDKQVQCADHGEQPVTFVCQHIIKGLVDNAPYGFFWADDPGNPRPDAWCTACERMVQKTGGEWTDESEAFASVSILCAQCYDRAKRMNLS
jgi:hypothetical protein